MIPLQLFEFPTQIDFYNGSWFPSFEIGMLEIDHTHAPHTHTHAQSEDIHRRTQTHTYTHAHMRTLLFDQHK